MSREEMNNVAEEIKEQDLESQEAGGSWKTAIQLTIAKKCGRAFTMSYECTSNNVKC